MDSVSDTLAGGFPHSEIRGSKFVRNSPRLIAAYHVLHRLSAPRHPPNALKALDHSHCRYPPAFWAERSRQEKRPASRFVRSRAVKTANLSRHAAERRRHSNKPSLHDVRDRRRPERDAANLFLADTEVGKPCPHRQRQAWWSQPVRPQGQRPEDGQLINPAGETKRSLVEPDGIEPTTSCLQSRRSPN